MHHRKEFYAEKMGLAPLSKEGGYFKETFRSPERIPTPGREGGERNVFTTIYYMIAPELGGKNFLHSNKSDNVHYFHDGWPAKYILVSPKGEVTEYVLGRDVAKGHVPQLRVPGGFLKAGKILEEEDCATFPGEIPFTLISEQVSPGFDYKLRTRSYGVNLKNTLRLQGTTKSMRPVRLLCKPTMCTQDYQRYSHSMLFVRILLHKTRLLSCVTCKHAGYSIFDKFSTTGNPNSQV